MPKKPYSILLTEVKKVQRKGGVSAAPIVFLFAGGQKLILFVRAGADVFKALLNGKEIVLYSRRLSSRINKKR